MPIKSTFSTELYNRKITRSLNLRTPRQLAPEFYEHFMCDNVKERKPCPIRELLPLENKPGLISLLAGKPNDAMFPFESFSFTITEPSHSSHPIPVSLTGTSLAAGLQYCPTSGLPHLVEWLVGLQERSHGRKPSEGWRLTVGNGSQDLLYKAFNAVVDPGDPILIETPVYPGVLSILRPLHCEFVEVATDEKGICSNDLRSTLENWPEGKRKPKALYTVPYGNNPTGMTTTTKRRREVLRLAQKYDFLILEDDPYYYLYFGKDDRPPSYFKLELETPELGRVVRFDSFSKILSAGMRMGFATGPKPIIDAMDVHTAYANLQGSSLVQAVTLALLEKWGYAGFLTHTERVSEFYRQKRDIFERALRTHLGDLAEWRTPEAGMFFWFKLFIDPDPKEEGDSRELIQTKAYEDGVLALPGAVFLPDGRKSAYVRVAFSLCTEEQVHEALRRLKVVLQRVRMKPAQIDIHSDKRLVSPFKSKL